MSGEEKGEDTFRELEVPEELIAATGIAAARTQERITAMVPLIWLAAQKSQNRIGDCAVPHLVEAEDVPLYALDKHTRLGREAIWRFACENDSVRACLVRFVPPSQRRSAVYVAAFYVDAAPECSKNITSLILGAAASSIPRLGLFG